MKAYHFLSCLFLFHALQGAAQKDWRTWPIADSLRAVSFYGELKLDGPAPGKKSTFAGIRADSITLLLQKRKRHEIAVVMAVGSGQMVTSGINVRQGKRKEAILDRAGFDTGTYRLLLVKAFDSAQHFSLFSGYEFLPALKQWKFIATVRCDGYGFIREVRTGMIPGKQRFGDSIGKKTVFRSNGTAHALEGSATIVSPLYWRNPADSSEQAAREKSVIELAKTSNAMSRLQPHEGIYHTINTPGTGRQVSVSDTVTVYYTGHLLGQSAPFDATAPGKPARFPLGGLIRGWQIGLPLVREGGKITLVIPSGLAYSTRTRSAKIPPNSILVFDIEVVKVDK
jgi:FKBP-type peptidyl-prolyl cis-trans isomerase FkpA